MPRTIRYLTHPQVVIDAAKPITQWSLTDIGTSRVVALARSGALNGTRQVISSAEVKALETAAPIAEALGCAVEIRTDMHENDRSSTGFLPPDEFEAVADRFFARPDESVRGWETASAAQARIVAAVQDCLNRQPTGDILFVGHGGVGTLLFCHLAGHPITRDFDQGPGGGGCYFEFSTPRGRPKSRWQPLERLMDPDPGRTA